MEARHLLKQLKDDGWYLSDTDGACRQYAHPERTGIITVCVRFTDRLGPESQGRAATPAEAAGSADPVVVIESTSTGASAYSPDLAGCVATGADEEEARSRMADALVLHHRGLQRQGS